MNCSSSLQPLFLGISVGKKRFAEEYVIQVSDENPNPQEKLRKREKGLEQGPHLPFLIAE
jgi:hypothetical protein